MPKIKQNQIALSPSLAKKYASNIRNLIGEEITMRYQGKDYRLTVSGIFNDDFDNLIVSSDLEQSLYQNSKISGYSISYDVKNFEDIVSVNKDLHKRGIQSANAAKEVAVFQKTFQTLNQLFLIVSVLILIVCLFISVMLLSKLQRSRYKEIGLLSALGFNKQTIRRMIMFENLLLSGTAFGINAFLILVTGMICSRSHLSFSITKLQFGLSMFSTLFVIELMSVLISHKLLHTEPAEALRK